MEGARPVRAPRGTALTARSWQTEAPLRMLQNNLDPEVAGPGPDRHLAPEIEACVQMAQAGILVDAAEAVVGPLA